MNDSRNSNHFIVYVLWEIILDWKAMEVMGGRLSKRERLKPYAYGTDAKGIPDKIKKGDIVWVLTIPKYGKYSSYPSLNAMMTVSQVIDQEKETDERVLRLIPDYIRARWNSQKKWRTVIIGDRKQSRYFPVNNAYSILVNSILKDKKFEIKKKVSGANFGYIGQYFQTIRKLEADPGQKLMSYQEKLHKADTVFISYRRGRGAPIIKRIAEALLKRKINCWLDINMMAQRFSNSNADQAEQYFQAEIKDAIKESRIFLAVKRKDYFKSKWTHLEYDVAKSHKTSPFFLEADLAILKDRKKFTELIKQIEKRLSRKL
jgi:hypothetical protein